MIDLIEVFSDPAVIVSLILISFLLATFIFKQLKLGKTYVIFTLLKTKRFLPWFDKFKHWKWLDGFADLGLVLGFGAIAFDYLYGRKYSLKKRIPLFILSFFLLSFLFYFFFNPMISANPYTKHLVWLFAFSFGLMGFAGFVLIALITQAYDILLKLSVGKKACPGVAPVIPGLQIPAIPITVPLHAWISLLIILVVHEGMHGILARKAKVAIKSAGLLLVGFLPIGAFVEPKDEDLAKADKRAVLRIFSSGPTANLAVFFFTSLFVLLFVFAIFLPFFAPRIEDLRREAVEALVIDKVDQNTVFCGDVFPHSAYGILHKGDKILKVNGIAVQILKDYQEQSLKNEKEITLAYETGEGEILEKTFQKNELGRIGIILEEQEKEDFVYPLLDWILLMVFAFFASFFNWFILLNLLVAAINFLPAPPFDGGNIAKTIFSEHLGFTGWTQEKKEKFVVRFFIGLILFLFILNALPLFFL